MGRPTVGKHPMTAAERQRRSRKLRRSRQSRFLKNTRNLYRTIEPRAVESLKKAARLRKGFKFIEPCAGYGDMVSHLVGIGGICVLASDIKPERDDIVKRDALTLTAADVPKGVMIITNPPFDVDMLHPMIEHFTSMADTVWLLLPVNWLCNQSSRPYFSRLRLIVPLGYRPKWYVKEDGDKKVGERRNFVWLKFTKPSKEPAVFLW